MLALTKIKPVGWTGFATPRLRRRYGVMTTGLIVGIMWELAPRARPLGRWHVCRIAAFAVFVPMSFFIGVAQLTAYRVLMLWVHDRTNSLLVATLMHASLTVSIVFVFTPTATGAANLIHGSALAGAMWIAVGNRRVGGQRTAFPPTAPEANGVNEVVHTAKDVGGGGWTMATTDRAFFDGYLAAWNAHDPAAVARYMAGDAIYEDLALGRVLHGPSEIAKFVEEATRASSDFRFEEVSLFSAGAVWASRGLAGEASFTGFIAGFLAFYFIALPAYRVLGLVVRPEGESVPGDARILSASTIVLQPVSAHGQFTWNFVLGAALWVVVAVVARVKRRELPRTARSTGRRARLVTVDLPHNGAAPLNPL